MDDTSWTRRRTGVAGSVPAGRRSGHVGRGADRLARQHDQAVVEVLVADADPVEPFVDLERDGLAPIIDGPPVRSVADLQPRPPEHERAVGVVLEVGLGIDAAGDLDVPRRSARRGQRDGLARR